MPVPLENRTLDKICIRKEIKGFFNVQITAKFWSPLFYTNISWFNWMKLTGSHPVWLKSMLNYVYRSWLTGHPLPTSRILMWNNWWMEAEVVWKWSLRYQTYQICLDTDGQCCSIKGIMTNDMHWRRNTPNLEFARSDMPNLSKYRQATLLDKTISLQCWHLWWNCFYRGVGTAQI